MIRYNKVFQLVGLRQFWSLIFNHKIVKVNYVFVEIKKKQKLVICELINMAFFKSKNKFFVLFTLDTQYWEKLKFSSNKQKVTIKIYV